MHMNIKINVKSKSMNNVTSSIIINIKRNISIESDLTSIRRIKIMRNIPTGRSSRDNIDSNIKIIRKINIIRMRKRKITRTCKFRVIV